MQDAAPPDVLGYVVVSLPDQASWQGFFVRPGFRGKGEAMLREARAANRVAAIHGLPTGVDEGLPDLDPAEQPVIGTLSAGLAHIYALSIAGSGAKGAPGPPPVGAQAVALASGIGALAYALHLATGERWLLVIARRDLDGRPGYRTRVRRFEADTLDAAREAIAVDLDHAKHMQGMADQFADAFRGLQKRGPGG